MSEPTYEKLVHVNYSSNYPVSPRMLAADFAEYQSPAARLHHLALHGWGVASGLEITATADKTGLQVAGGVAIAAGGQVIVLPTGGAGLLGDTPPLTETPAPVVVPAASLTPFAGKKIVVTIQFQETLRQVPVPLGGSNNFPAGKLEQTPWVRVFAAEAFAPSDDQVVLALADVGNDGKVKGVQAAAPGVAPARKAIAPRVAGLQFVRSGEAGGTVGEVLAPELRSSADGLGLVLGGRLQVIGRVNGRDVSGDGALLDDLRNQVRALQERLQAIQGSLVPIGTVALFGSPTPPQGWLACDGKVLQTKDYPELAQILGKRYGGDGLNTFATPPLAGRFPLGAGGGRETGVIGGSETHALTNGELPAHTHAGTTQGANQIGFLRAVHQVGTNITFNHVVGYKPGPSTNHVPSDVPGAAHQHNFTTSQSPGCEGHAFPILPPFLAMSYVIRAR